MEYFEINSREKTSLKDYSENKIVVREVLVVGDNLMDIMRPIKIETTLPNKEFRSFNFHPGTFYSNRTRKRGTDLPFEFVVHYCPYTTMQIDSNEDRNILLQVGYTKVEGELIKVLVKRDMDGFVFSLPTSSMELIISKFPKAHPARNLTVAYDAMSSFESIHGRIDKYIIPALTDLSIEEIQRSGGILFYDALTGVEIGKR